MGGGFELVLASDLVVASASSKFALPEVRLGLIPGWGGTQRLVQHVGPNRAKELIATGEAMSASAAYGFGIVNRVVPVASSTNEVADSYIDTLVARAPLALRAIKTTITAAYDPSAGGSVGAALETKSVLELLSSADGIEGVNAFIEKREPRFVGH
jgi:enoyl-CoA hydratase/carnithine racemase